MTFQNESFDLFITQDVFEHVMEPNKAFKEIERVLKPGGAHVFTVLGTTHFPKLCKGQESMRVELSILKSQFITEILLMRMGL